MKYSFAEIGERIRTMRKKLGVNQDDFVAMLKDEGVEIARNRLSAMENGNEKSFCLPSLMACCKLFKCDMGYLLGEYSDCKTRDNQFIHEETGLSRVSVERLVSKSSDPQNIFLDSLIGSDKFAEIDFLFFEYEAFIRRCNRHTAWYVDTEMELEKLDDDSEEASLLRAKLGKGMMTSGSLEGRVFALEYQISLCFSEMLKDYRKSHLDLLKR